uniref:Carbohydrate kinase PfkB domain-containing protein n=1 Tax=Daphnia galeata TaxID=27404 RepID=A0A8J2WGH0_9CRUS|nr:unnamed protein product [Daphnia galeata]
MDASTHRGSISRSYGGVGRNLADGLSRLAKSSPLFVSLVGDDESGRDLIRHNPLMDSRGILRLASASTASYTVILDNKGDCQFGIGDLKIHDQLTVDKVRQFEEDIAKCRLLIMDGNMELATMEYILDVCRSAKVPAELQTLQFTHDSKVTDGGI